MTLVLSLVVVRSSAQNTIIDGISVRDFNLGGLPYAQAAVLLADEYDHVLKTEFNFTFQNEIKTITLGELGVSFDGEKTIEDVKDLSYGDNIGDHLENRISTMFDDVKTEPIFAIDDAAMQSGLLLNFPSLKWSTEAEIKVKTINNIEVTPHTDGLTMDFEDLKKQIYLAVQNPEPTTNFTISPIPILANYRTENAQEDATILKELLKSQVRFFHTESKERTHEFKTPLEPSWVTVKNKELIFNEPGVLEYINANIVPKIDHPLTNAVIKKLPEEGSIYATVEGIAMDGVTVDVEKTLKTFTENIKNRNFEVPIDVTITQSKVTNETGQDMGDLQRISQGKSGYKGSGINRKFNIKKGLEERLNNILVAPGAEFNFNDVIGPVEGSYGWKQALTIFNGDELKPAPGGGLCQVSTTLYRAVLGAGLEVLEFSNHSLYILYYEEYGNGLDAAVYPGSKNFRFKNITDGYLFIQAYVDGDIAYVDFYGTPAHKSVELIGPFYSGRVPDEYKELINPDWNEIGWVQKVVEFDGTVKQNPLFGSYKTKPRKLYGYGE